nr:uncharacterized protein LOC129167039 [Nothobranchius furzeri]
MDHSQKLIKDANGGTDILKTSHGPWIQKDWLIKTSVFCLMKTPPPDCCRSRMGSSSQMSSRRQSGSLQHLSYEVWSTYDQEIASLLLLRHLLPSPPGGQRSPRISACDAVERLVVFHKSCCSLEEHLQSQLGRQPYLLVVGRQRSKIESFYIVMDKSLIPCQANRSLGAFDELFKTHFVFNVSYDAALVSFYTFLQTTVYNIDVVKMKESPRVRDLRARLLNQSVVLFCE